MVTNTNVKRRCDSCHQWVEGTPRICPNCNDFLDHRVREKEEKEAEKAAKAARKQAEFESKSPIVQFFIRVGRVIEVIFLSITGFIAWLLFWIGG